MIIFHKTFIIRSIFHNIKARTLSFATDKITNKIGTILFIHFTNFNRSIDLVIKKNVY